MPKLKSDDLVMLLGYTGFLGGHVYGSLHKTGCQVYKSFNRKVFDLTKQEDTFATFKDCFKVFGKFPDYLINCAGFNGGINFNIDYPDEIFLKNTRMVCNIFEASQYFGVKKLVNIISSCSYADDGSELLKEENYWHGGLPNDTIRAHGLAKRNIHALSMAYYKRYGMVAVSPIVTNMYGPGDSDSLAKTKVVMAIIKKFVDAKENNASQVECWGTGKPLREFALVSDVSDILVKVLEDYDCVELPLNIGTGKDVSIKYLAETIAAIVGYKGEIYWNTSKPDGQMKKLLCVDRMKNILGFEPQTSLEDGLKKTIEWYMENK